MGKIKDEIAYLKARKNAKQQYLGLNFERTVLLLTGAVMGFDMKNDDFGNIIITSLPVDNRKPTSTKLSFELGDQGFDPQNENLAEVQKFFQKEIQHFLLKDKPFPSFYEAYHTLMREFYAERNADDNGWQLNNAKNLLRRSSQNLVDLFNGRPDVHSMSKNISFYAALCTLKHYLDMPKWKTYNSNYENCYPVNIFTKQTKHMRPIYVGVEIDMCDKYRTIHAPSIATTPDEKVEEETKRAIAQAQYNSAVEYMQLNNKIALDIEKAGQENFWHTRRLREYFKSR